MWAASRSGLTSAVMRFSSPIASALSSQTSRSDALRRVASADLALGCSTVTALPPAFTLISMTQLPYFGGAFGLPSCAQHATLALADLGDDLGCERIDLLLGHGLVARLDRHRNRDRLLPGLDALALVDVEHRHAGDHLAIHGLR